MPAPSTRTFAIAAALQRMVVDDALGTVALAKAPADIVDISWDWTAFLALNGADTITAFDVAVEERIPVEDEVLPDDAVELDVTDADQALAIVTATVFGGVIPAEDHPLRVSCAITTAGGRAYTRSIWIQVTDQL